MPRHTWPIFFICVCSLNWLNSVGPTVVHAQETSPSAIPLTAAAATAGGSETDQAPGPTEAPPDPRAGQLIEWEGWQFRWQFRDIEGLILTDVYFRGTKVLKSIGLAEIYVPYAPGWPRPQDFALGGFRANPMPLELGRDCLPGSNQCRAYNRDGQKSTQQTADVMIHEEPMGLLYAGRLGRASGKMLVLWCMVHFPGVQDGYTYILRWKLQSDGILCAEVGATGGLQHLGVGVETGRGVIVGRDENGQVFAPSHVHNFYFRIDFDIDGSENNAIEEFNYQSDPNHPLMNAAVWTRGVKEGWRFTSDTTFRAWRVVNTQSRNAQGHLKSYQLIPGGQGSFRDGQNVAALQGDFFVTRYHAQEYPYTTADPRRMLDALQAYLDDESIDNTDLVVWYRLGFAHHPRSEDWGAQPVMWSRFELMPRDFLDASPLKATE